MEERQAVERQVQKSRLAAVCRELLPAFWWDELAECTTDVSCRRTVPFKQQSHTQGS